MEPIPPATPPPVVPPVDPKPFYQSRTFWLNLVGLLLLALASPEIVEILPVESRPYIAAAVAVLNILNRSMSTTSPLTVTPPSPEQKQALRLARREKVLREAGE
ncbi:MAG: hypothetical protein AB7G23_21425 [Vicinamibacterales bacterium]